VIETNELIECFETTLSFMRDHEQNSYIELNDFLRKFDLETVDRVRDKFQQIGSDANKSTPSGDLGHQWQDYKNSVLPWTREKGAYWRAHFHIYLAWSQILRGDFKTEEECLAISRGVELEMGLDIEKRTRDPRV